MKRCDQCEYGVFTGEQREVLVVGRGWWPCKTTDEHCLITPAFVTCKRYPTATRHNVTDWCGEFRQREEVQP